MEPSLLLRQIDNDCASLSLLKSQQASLLNEMAELSNQLNGLQQALSYTQIKAQETQEAVKFHIEDIVNTAMNAVFPDEYTFKLNFVVRRNRTEADIILLEKSFEIDPLKSVGGGVADVLSIALRIVLLIISKKRRVLFLDEPLKNVDKDRKPIAFEMLKRLCSEMKIQVIAVTHDPLMVAIADKEFKVTKKNGISSIS